MLDEGKWESLRTIGAACSNEEMDSLEGDARILSGRASLGADSGSGFAFFLTAPDFCCFCFLDLSLTLTLVEVAEADLTGTDCWAEIGTKYWVDPVSPVDFT